MYKIILFPIFYASVEYITITLEREREREREILCKQLACLIIFVKKEYILYVEKN